MDGILIVDKPKGITSHDVVDLIRRRFGFKKVGHGGTLDPMATGVLVMLIGKATKLSSLFLSGNKEYVATMMLGATSDTGDALGKVAPTGRETALDEGLIRGVFKSFSGEILQRPPAYSALKVKGKKLYQYARKGIFVEVAPRLIVIRDMEILEIALPEITFRVECSKGTYIRQLSADIGDKLGCGAHLVALRRTRSGKFSIDEAISREDLMKMDIKALSERMIGYEDIPRYQ